MKLNNVYLKAVFRFLSIYVIKVINFALFL